MKYLLLLLTFTLMAEDIKINVINRVYDGDTFFVQLTDCRKPDIVCKDMGIRVSGVDTPEIKTSSEREKELALKAKSITESFLSNPKKIVLINCEKDKFFRIDCDVVNTKGVYLKDVLIQNKVAVPYYGDKKIVNWSTF